MDLFLLAVFAQVADTVAVVEPVEGVSFTELIGAIIPVVVAFLTTFIMKYLKIASDFLATGLPDFLSGLIKIDGFPAAIQRIVVLVVAFILTWIGNWAGVPLPTELAMVGETDVSSILTAILSGVFAISIHAGDKVRNG